MIEDELVHWYKDDDGVSHKSALKLETAVPTSVNGYPRDGTITLRIANTIGTVGFRLSPDEALRVSSLLCQLSKELINKKRVLWQQEDDEK
ncbi:MAG: hypothetical protein WC408_06155 [Candidatus Micrarchaeia archaeon]|jgi:hypothetical protein